MAAAEKLTPNQIVERLDELPTLPTIVYELSRVISDPMSSTSDIEAIMANDQSLTAKVLRLANSAYYAIPGGVSNLQRAIAYIGYDAIHQLVLSASIMKALEVKSPSVVTTFDPNQFWKHSLGVAMAAETAARFVHHRTPADLFTCGLVHDMGKIAYFIISPEEFTKLIQHTQVNKSSFTEAEFHLESTSHTFIGRELALHWRLPPLIQASAAHHHEKDPKNRGELSPEMNCVVDLVYLANLLVHALQFGNSGHEKVQGVPKELLDRLNISQDQLKELIGSIKTSLASAENFLKIIGG